MVQEVHFKARVYLEGGGLALIAQAAPAVAFTSTAAAWRDIAIPERVARQCTVGDGQKPELIDRLYDRYAH